MSQLVRYSSGGIGRFLQARSEAWPLVGSRQADQDVAITLQYWLDLED